MTGRPLSKELLSGGIDIDRIFLKREQFYIDKNDRPAPRHAGHRDRPARRIRWRFRPAKRLAYDKLVIATGAPSAAAW